MAKRDSFLVRLDPKILNAIRNWADDEMRSVNGQIEYILRNSLRTAGRLGQKDESGGEKQTNSKKN